MTKNDVLVSVIVPIYNVEKYIQHCVESLLHQTHKRLEIILVDDGTKDNSGKIIDELAKTDNRIVVIHKENAGVSSARNTGLDASHGEYVTFVDGDDYVDEEYVSYFLDLVMDNDCEMAMNLKNHTYKSAISKNDKQRTIDALTAMEYIYTNKIFVAVWNKIYKRSWLNAYNLRFDTKYWYGEGMLFNITCLQYTDKVAVGEKMVYHQVFNPSSAMRKFNLESNYCGMRSMHRQKEIWKKTNKKVENAWAYHYRCFYGTILNGLVECDMVDEYQEEYKLCLKKLRSNISIPLKANISLKQKIIQLALFICPVITVKRSVRKTKALVKKLSKNSNE